MRPSSAGAISCLSICSFLGLHAGQVAQALFSEIAGDDSVDLAHGIADTGEGGGVRLKDRLPDGAGQIELAALIGKIIPQAGGEITGIEKAAAEGPLCLAGGQTQRLVAGLDGLCAGGIVGDKPQIVQRQAGLSREQCREGAQLLGIGAHALLSKLPDHRMVALLVLGDLQQRGNGGFPLVHRVGVAGGPQNVLLRKRVELGADLAALESAQCALLQTHAGPGDAAGRHRVCRQPDEEHRAVPGGLDEKGEPTRDPSIIYQTKRVLPMGYWKGSGLSILLDLIGTILSNGNSVMKIGTFEREIGLTQIFIVIDPLKFINIERMDQIVHDLKKSLKDSHPIQERREVYYPGELETKVRKENMKKGLPVIEAKWKEILNLL